MIKLFSARLVSIMLTLLLATLASFAQNISRVEYFVDEDPGFGAGIPLSFAEGAEVNASVSIDIMDFTDGFHRLHIRALTAPYLKVQGDSAVHSGGWSIVAERVFYKANLDLPTSISSKIVRAEYFLDQDPGHGQGISIPMTPSADLTNLPFTINVTSLTAGFHTLFVRFQDQDGRWSHSPARSFYKDELISVTNNPSVVDAGEYFLDTDPGFGAGTPLTLMPETDISTLPFSLDLGTVTPGSHQLFVRFKDSRGNWGQTSTRSFYHDDLQSSDTSRAQLVAGEYFLDADPGFGKGVSIPVNGSSEDEQIAFSVDVSGLSTGFHQMSVRFKNSRESWSLASVRSIYKDDNELVNPDSAQIVTGEYFVDTDPGFGIATPLTVTPGTDIASLLFSLDLGTVSPGSHHLCVRFKDSRGNWGQTNVRSFFHDDLQTSDTTEAQLATGEYFFDTDPGFGKGVIIPVNGSKDNEEVALSVDVSSLANGFHQLFVRFKDSKNNWGLSSARSIYKEGTEEVTQDSALIGTGEYFVDSDPGFGSGTALTITPDTDISNLLFSLDLSAVSPGAHQLFVRFKDSRGNWGQTNTRAFYHDDLSTPDTARSVLVAGEYFIDSDPGFGQGVVIPGSVSGTEDEISFSIDISALTTGFHSISTRFRDDRGNWGLSSSRMFYNEVLSAGTATANIVKGEYFIGEDPGFGKGVALSVTAAPSLSNVMFALDIDTLRAGFHHINTRFQDSKGKWGLTNGRAFYKQRLEENVPLPDLADLEYYIDDDPGFGKGKKLAITPTTDLSNFVFPVDIDSIALGDHTLYVRAQDANGNWSLTNVSMFRIEPQSGLYVTIGQIEKDLCIASKVAVPFKTSGPFSEDNVFSVQLSDQFGSFTSPTVIGSQTGIESDTIIATVPYVAAGSSYRVRIVSSNPAKTSVSNNIPLSIHAIPPVFSITGDSIVCFGSSEYALTNFASDKNKYVWSLSGGGVLSVNEEKASVAWNAEGNFILKVTYTGLCAADDSVKTLDVRAVNRPLTGTFQNLIPANGEANLSLPINFSWSPIPNASLYDIYIWQDNQSKPTTPTVADITAINYTLNNPASISDEASYNWQVVAKMACYELAGPIQTFNTRQLPDLIVESISAPSTATSETEISVNWRIKNQGTGSTGNGSWVDIVYLSDQPTLGTGSETYTIAVASNFSALAVGQSYTSASYNFKLPQGVQGNYYVIVQSNYYGNFKEKVTTNNLLTSSPVAVTLAPYPDLVVKTVTVSPLSAFSEDEVTVTYNIANEGAGPTTASSWYDQISIGTTETPNPATDLVLANIYRNGAIAVNGNYTASEKIRLPQRINGTYFVHVAADRGNQVFEYIKEENNSLNSLAMNIIQRPTANLIVSTTKATPATAANGQSVTLSWITHNDGATETTHQWMEAVYLSKDETFEAGADLLAHTLSRTEPIASLGTSNTQQTFALPQNLTERDYYYFVVTDWQNSIYESPGEDDNLTPAFGKVTIKNPDLKPLTLSAPPSALSGQTIEMQWTAKDDSDAGIHNNIWVDGIYLSTDQNFDPGVDKLLTSATISQFVPNGGEYTRALSAYLPPGISGNYHLILVADQHNAIAEKNEDNNRITAPITLTLAPWPDIDVTQIELPETDTLGTLLRLSYTFRNTGAGALAMTNWTDGVYLSPVDTLDESRLILLGTVIQGRSLAINETVTQQASFVLPGVLPAGAYYLVVRSDQGNVVFENGAKGNNTLVSTSAVTLISSPAIDLSVIGGKILSASVTAGQSADLEWTVRNNSAVATAISSWTDAIYLSSDAFFDDTDVLLSSQPVDELLASGASYKKSLTVTLPQEIEGNVYFLIMADSYRQHNDVDRGNNIIPLTSASGNPVFPIQLPPPADLLPRLFTAPSNSLAGQTVPVSFTIRNDGTGTTPAPNWTDQLFLSTDTQLGNDIPLSAFARTSILAAGEEYTVEGDITLPANIAGNYILLLKTDANNQVFERGKENNNLIYRAILIGSPAPADLTVSDIILPVGAQLAGSNVTIGWTLNNVGSNAVAGSVREAVYISADNQLDATDVLFGTLEGAINIPALTGIERTLQMPLANLAVGSYFGIVKTDILNSIAEQNEDNNQTTSESKLTIDIQELQLNTLTAAEMTGSIPLYYRLEIPAGLVNETLSITLKSKGAQGAINRLFLKKGDIPNVNQYDFAATVPFQADQELIVPALSQGTYYLMALGTGGQPMELLAKIIPFGISAVESNKGGNTGQVTVKIVGAKFQSGTAFRLKNSGNTIAASKMQYVNQTTAYATFDLVDKAIGAYDVEAGNPDGQSVKLANGFTIEKGPGRNFSFGGENGFVCNIGQASPENSLSTDFVVPASARLSVVTSFIISYQNASSVDINIPTKILISLNEESPISLSANGLKDNKSELVLEFKETNGPPGILRPGASGFFKVYTISNNRSVASIDLLFTE